MAYLNSVTMAKIEDVVATGCFSNELGVDWEPPTVELIGSNIVLTERMRLL